MNKTIIDKYWLILLLTSNIVAQYYPISHIGNMIFLVSQAVGFVYCLINCGLLFTKEMSQRFSFIYVFAAIYILYQFSFGLIHINERTWTYLVSKIIIDFSIAICIYKNRDTVTSLIPMLFAFIIPVLILIGFAKYNVYINARCTMGFGNPNSLGSIGAITFGICLFCDKIRSSYLKYFLASICLFAVLMSGSRGALAIVLIALFFKFKLNLKNITVVILFIVGSVIVPPMLGYNPVGISRLVETTQQKDAFSAGRETERKASILMIKENPITGNGLYAQQSEEAKKISLLGSHNAYIDFLKMLGIPLGGLLIIYIFKKIMQLLKSFWKYPNKYRMHLFIIVSGALAANFEAYIWGVNHYITTLFFISMCFLQQEYYEISNLEESEITNIEDE